MQRSTFNAAIAAAAIGMTTISAMARERGPDFSALDTDSSGEVTLTEMQALGEARFANTDTDGDGFLSVTELEAAGSERAKKRAARMIERLDADQDGKLSLAEMKQTRRDPARLFERCLLYTSPSPRDLSTSRMPSSA